MADLKEALSVLVKTARSRVPAGIVKESLKEEIAEDKRTFRSRNVEMEKSNAFPMMPERILAEVREVLPRDAIITTDVGWNKSYNFV